MSILYNTIIAHFGEIVKKYTVVADERSGHMWTIATKFNRGSL